MKVGKKLDMGKIFLSDVKLAASSTSFDSILIGDADQMTRHVIRYCPVSPIVYSL